MILCPNCNADMVFDPSSQLLKCNYCDATLDPEKYRDSEGLNAQDSEYFDTTIFTCPQCGGEIMSTDETAATFCSYCGTSVMLSSRMEKTKRPAKIIPFKLGIEDCKRVYRNAVKRAIFAPKSLREDSELEKFRGIYMPYWSYRCDVDQGLSQVVRKDHREGDYIVHDDYKLSVNCNGTIDGISYDALSSFDDSISGGIGVFNVADAKDFNTAYLSGFYADKGDVSDIVYRGDVANTVKTSVAGRTNALSDFSGYSFDIDALEKTINPKFAKTKEALYPVWFLANRTGDRVSFAVVNGQSGKVAADIPIDPKKYIIGSIILMLPLFLLFNRFLTLTPLVVMIIALILDSISLIIAVSQNKSINDRDNRLTDRGFNSVHKVDEKHIKMGIGDYIAQVIALVFGIVIILVNPIRDIIYYDCCSCVMLATGFSFISIIKKHNFLSTRKPQQLNARGGDENEAV